MTKNYHKSLESVQQALPKILDSTPQWLIVDKPAGWLSIPGRMASAQTQSPPVLLEWLKSNFGPVWAVHRLDLETSGVILFARSAEDHQLANTWFQKRQIKKIYYCIASGKPTLPVFKINDPIENAPSLTQVVVKEKYQEGFLAEVFPQTGRRHQIRIHLSKRGFPIWGDIRYGGLNKISFAKTSLDVTRVTLHASRLELPSGEKFESPLASDFQNGLDLLRSEGQSVLF